jgi:hypothetical protein
MPRHGFLSPVDRLLGRAVRCRSERFAWAANGAYCISTGPSRVEFKLDVLCAHHR